MVSPFYVIRKTKIVSTAKYLGITISSNMTWNAHINNITLKAQKLLGFLRRNLQIKNEHTKSMAYKSLVILGSTIWSPHTDTAIEKVQRRAARYTTMATGRFHNTSSVTSMLDQLEWNSLETHRNIAKVTMLYKITISSRSGPRRSGLNFSLLLCLCLFFFKYIIYFTRFCNIRKEIKS